MNVEASFLVMIVLLCAGAVVARIASKAGWLKGFEAGYIECYDEQTQPEILIPKRKDEKKRRCAMGGMPYCQQCPNRRAIIREQDGHAGYDTGEWVCTYKNQEGDSDMQRTIKPMLFNTDMVRAILDGKKTMTRRLIKPQPPKEYPYCQEAVDKSCWWWNDRDADDDMMEFWPSYDSGVKPPFKAGDILYVRETWSKYEDGEYAYRTDYGDTEDDSFPPSMLRWHPSIHMPKEAARIFLRIKDVRAERLRLITEDDIYSEGVQADYGYTAFRDVWNKTIKPKDRDRYGWDANPWVWVIEFERISKQEAMGEGGDKL